MSGNSRLVECTGRGCTRGGRRFASFISCMSREAGRVQTGIDERLYDMARETFSGGVMDGRGKGLRIASPLGGTVSTFGRTAGRNRLSCAVSLTVNTRGSGSKGCRVGRGC